MTNTSDQLNKTFDPELAARVLSSAQMNGDTISDLVRLACTIAVENHLTVTTDDVRDQFTEIRFDERGWIIE